ncbi:MAG: hypothetical protein JO340_12855 [Acidobacteriaceae bacterium]|nr:hypothetical protein [Acidobacteriaceae bacterium]
MPSTRFERIYPGIVQELEYLLAVERAVQAGCLLRQIRKQAHFGRIDHLANTIHPAIFAEVKKSARAISVPKIVRKRSAEFFATLFMVRRDLLHLHAFEREHARVGELRTGDLFKIRWQIESSIVHLLLAGVRFRLGYPLREQSLNKRIENLNSLLAARVDALAPGWV